MKSTEPQGRESVAKVLHWNGWALTGKASVTFQRPTSGLWQFPQAVTPLSMRAYVAEVLKGILRGIHSKWLLAGIGALGATGHSQNFSRPVRPKPSIRSELRSAYCIGQAVRRRVTSGRAVQVPLTLDFFLDRPTGGGRLVAANFTHQFFSGWGLRHGSIEVFIFRGLSAEPRL